VQQAVGSAELTLRPVAGPFATLAPPPDRAISRDAAGADRDLTWQTSIGQIIFLQSLVHES
jgi:hypothetical protein